MFVNNPPPFGNDKPKEYYLPPMPKNFTTLLFIFLIAGLFINISVSSNSIQDSPLFSTYETPHLNETMYNRYTPSKITPLMQQLPEYNMFGGGYVCNMRQPAPVYRMPLQRHRSIGYREANWNNNTLYNYQMNPINYGGYTF